jgi:hypothetical protein
MIRLSTGLVTLAITFAAAASATTVRIEGAYTSESRSGDTMPISPLPFSMDLEMNIDPSAVITNPNGESWEQVHSRQETHTDQFSAPHPRTLPSLQRLQEWQGVTLNSERFADYADPRYDAVITSASRHVVFGLPGNDGITTWTFQVDQHYSDGINNDIEEQWRARFQVTLVRPLDLDTTDYQAPWTDADLASFLDGFEEAGGTVSVVSESTFTQFPGSGRIDRALWLEGEFHIASVQQPIPEPTSIALLLAGLGGVAWRTRGRSTNRPA